MLGHARVGGAPTPPILHASAACYLVHIAMVLPHYVSACVSCILLSGRGLSLNRAWAEGHRSERSTALPKSRI